MTVATAGANGSLDGDSSPMGSLCHHDQYDDGHGRDAKTRTMTSYVVEIERLRQTETGRQ